LEHRLTERSRVFIFNGNPVRNMSKLIYAIFGKIYDENLSLFSLAETETNRLMRHAVRDRSTGERKFSERKRVVAKSKSGKDIMNYFRSENIE